MVDRRPVLDWQPVLVAAGGSSRFGSANKLLERIGDAPAVVHSARALLAVPSTLPLIAVVSPDTGEALAAWAGAAGIRRLVLVPGGSRRRDSVEAGLRACTGEYIAVHDGARPLATSGLLERLLEAAQGGPGAVPGIPVTDTIARIGNDGLLSAHVSRASLRALQTPQVIRREDWLNAAAGDPDDVTDESAMIARLGLRCAVIPGEPTNIKLTTPVDLAAMRAIVAAGSKPCSG